MKKEREISSVAKRISQLKSLKNSLKWKEDRHLKHKKLLEKQKDEAEYRKYTEDLRRMAIGVIQEEMERDKEHR